ERRERDPRRTGGHRACGLECGGGELLRRARRSRQPRRWLADVAMERRPARCVGGQLGGPAISVRVRTIDPIVHARGARPGRGTCDTPWSSSPTAEALYTDDFSGVAVVEVSDGTHVASAAAAVTIANRSPEIERLDAVAQAAFRIEIAGEKWHDLSFTVASDSGVLASLDLVRKPGSPSEQAATTGVLAFSLREHVTATLAYTPLNSRVNGQLGGDNPAWIVVVFPDGQEKQMFHNFNIRHPTTWTWTLTDLASFFVRSGITFRA